MSKRMNKERAIELLKNDCCYECSWGCRNPIECNNKECDYRQAIIIAIECVEEKIKREKNAHRGKHKAYWTYTGNGTDSGTGLEIQCSYCGKKYNIFSADETKPFSYEKYQKCLDEHCMRECPNCKREMVGWRKYYHSYQKPTPIRYYERKE